MFKIAGRTAVVTGGGHGLGRAFAKALADAGANVCIADIDLEAAEDVAGVIRAGGGAAFAIRTDVSRSAATAAMAAATLKAFGRLDILVNNAGIVLRRERVRQPFDELSEAEWDRVMEVNVKGSWLAARAVIAQMRAQKYGKIINLASGTYFAGAPYWVHYGASKGAVVGLTRSLARELGESNICVNVLCPGLVETEETMRVYPDFVRSMAKARCLQRVEQPDDLIGALLFLASEHSDFMTGQLVNIDGGMFFH